MCQPIRPLKKILRKWLCIELFFRIYLIRGPRREVPQRVANPLCTSSINQKIRMLGKSILVIVAVVDHVRGGGGPIGASFDGFRARKREFTNRFLRISGCKNRISKKLQAERYGIREFVSATISGANPPRRLVLVFFELFPDFILDFPRPQDGFRQPGTK